MLGVAVLDKFAWRSSGLLPDRAQFNGNRPPVVAWLSATTWIVAGALIAMHDGSVSAEQVALGGGAPELRTTAPLADAALLDPPAEPDCEFRTNDPAANERQKLD